MAQRQRWTKNAHDHTDDSEEEEEEAGVQANDLTVSCIATSAHLLHDDNNCNVVATTLAGSTGTNQDRALLCSPWKGALLLGVLDGHDDDGEAISEHVKCELPKRLAEKWKNANVDEEEDDDVMVKALKETFCEIHESLPTTFVGGCAVSCVLKCSNNNNSRLYVANCGDSLSTICAVKGDNTNNNNGAPPPPPLEIVFLTRRDIPELPEERERIERMGGAVISGRVAYRTKEDSRTRPGLAMSRSIGDFDMIGVIAEPVVHVLDVRQLIGNRILCISATDGLTDCIPPREVAESLANAFHGKDGDVLTAAQDLLLRAAQVWKTKTGGLYRDDITIVACSIEY